MNLVLQDSLVKRGNAVGSKRLGEFQMSQNGEWWLLKLMIHVQIWLMETFIYWLPELGIR